MEPQRKEPYSSPGWQPGSRLVAAVLMVVIGIVVLFLLRSLLVPLILALLLAYLFDPLVTRMSQNRRISRGIASLIIVLVLVVILLGATTGLGLALSEGVVQLAAYLYDLSVELPDQIASLANLQIPIGPWVIDFSQINIEPLLTSLASAVSPILSQAGSILGSVAVAAASTLSLFFLVLVFGYYLLSDFAKLEVSVLGLVPVAYREDFRRLMGETNGVWRAFFRGQLILAVVMGVGVALVMAVLGVNFSLVLGLIAGLMELVPVFGPLISGAVAVVVALFQDGNPWGLTPIGFGVLVLVVFMVIQQLENAVLLPRILGQSLNLHPLAILLAVLAGGILAGIIGVLLASPVAATLRVWVGYVYRKTIDLESWPDPVVSPRERLQRALSVKRLLARFRSSRVEVQEEEQEEVE